MSFRAKLAILSAQLVAWCSKTFRLGAGATWPGEIAIRIEPQILSILSKKAPHIILVAGTNGKTTTAKMIETIIGASASRNASGANLENGLVSALIANPKTSYYIFEVDEATLPNILERITPDIIIANNLFRDQLDRYGELDIVATKWHDAFGKLSKKTTIIANADDPHIAYLTSKLESRVKYFGLADESLFLPSMQHATDTIFCPRCGSRLLFEGTYFSHLGEWKCPSCSLTKPKVDLSSKDVASPIEGVYNIYNTLAATLTGQLLGVKREEAAKHLTSFTAAFGRMENIIVHGRRIKILLSKNPTGFNESLRTVANSKDKGPVLCMLNDRIPDGRDVSWIWDVDFEQYKMISRFFAGGDRVFDMALRLKYADITPSVISDISEAILATKKNEVLWILPTYSAMLNVRNQLLGRKIL